MVHLFMPLSIIRAQQRATTYWLIRSKVLYGRDFLLYTMKKSGSEIDTVKFNTSQRIKNENAVMSEVNSALSTAGSLTSNIEKGNIAGGILTGVSGATTSAFIAGKGRMKLCRNYKF